MPSSQDPKTTFAEFDRDGDGQITAAEFVQAMAVRDEAVTPDEVESIFAAADHDNDGRINAAEFVQAWNA